ncbi:hypothetical protein K439DRAFT_1382329 [Ramaria rubella]|nr:hypothetical protein K439DRAFT_1382329 [Ramaria rubella]
MGEIPERELQLPVCVACGTQFDESERIRCYICDDPRAAVPVTGQSWTTLKTIQLKHKNIFEPLADTDREVYSIFTEPTFAIGQRALLIRTPHGNVLWDLITLIDDDTIEKIKDLGGLNAIVISHPHFYTTNITWSRAFGGVPVYVAQEDDRWLARRDNPEMSLRKLITSPAQGILPQSGITAIKAGGHFPGSLVLHWKTRLFTADTVMVVRSGLYDIKRSAGTVTFAFMWAYPNMIPLPPEAISHIMRAIEPYDFDSAHAGWVGLDVTRDAKRKMIESANIVRGASLGIQPGEEEKREFWK